MNLECPHCNAHFTAADARPRKFVQCASCQQRFLVTEQHSASDLDSDDAFPPALIAFLVIAGLVVLGLMLSLFMTPAISAGIVLSLGLSVVAFWKQDEIQQYLKRRKQQKAERRKAKEQAAAEAQAEAESQAAEEETSEKETPAPSADSITSATGVETPVGTQESAQPPGNQPWNVPPTTPEFFMEPAGEATQPPTNQTPVMGQPAQQQPLLPQSPQQQPPTPQTALPEPAMDETVVYSPSTPAEPESPAPASEPESLTAGLPEPYQVFLNAAMTQSKWPLQELEGMARLHDLQWDDVIKTINDWSQNRFGDPMLVEDGEEVWVQLPLI